MNKGIALAGSLSLVSLAGCKALHQAPLVYSSGVIIGVSVTASPAESYTPSLTVGLKQLDAAYVPVMVALDCDDVIDALNKADDGLDINGARHPGFSGTEMFVKALERCSPAPVQADNEQSKDDGSSSGESRQLAELKKLVAASESEKIKRDKAIEDHGQAYKAVADAEAAEALTSSQLAPSEPRCDKGDEGGIAAASKDQASTNGSATASVQAAGEVLPACDSSGYRAARDKYDSELEIYKKLEVAKKAATNSVGEKKSQLAAANLSVKAAEASVQAADKELFDFLRENRDVLSTAIRRAQAETKHDAYSVYGTFAADTGASTAGPRSSASTGNASAESVLKVGKVFSTGVASQNLTQGLQEFYGKRGVTDALVAAYDKCLTTVELVRGKRIAELEKRQPVPDETARKAESDQINNGFKTDLVACGQLVVAGERQPAAADPGAKND